MGAVWVVAAGALGVLAAVGVLMVRRLAVELRATAQRLRSVTEATAAVRADVTRTRAAIDSLDVPSLRHATAERVLGMAARWAARRVLPF